MATEGNDGLAMAGLNVVWVILAAVAFLAVGVALSFLLPTLTRAVAARSGVRAGGYQGKHRR